MPMLRKLTKREMHILILCVFIVLICTEYNVIIKPLNENILLTDTMINKEKAKLAKSLNVLSKEKKYKQRYIEYLSRFLQKQNDEEVMSLILSEIEDIAGKLKLQISELKPKKVNIKQYFSSFSVSLKIDSSFIDIMNFLYILQSNPYLFKVEELKFDKSFNRKNQIVRTHLVLSRILILKNK